jgi:hypothetical protein
VRGLSEGVGDTLVLLEAVADIRCRTAGTMVARTPATWVALARKDGIVKFHLNDIEKVVALDLCAVRDRDDE